MSRKKLTENYSEFCLYLAAIFPWHPYDAARFLLTGERPEVVPLQLSYNRHSRVITLNFAPWISEKTVRRAYRKCQKLVQGGRQPTDEGEDLGRHAVCHQAHRRRGQKTIVLVAAD